MMGEKGDDDEVRGLGGSDEARTGGDGNDVIYGGSGGDFIEGEHDDDVIHAGDGGDYFVAGGKGEGIPFSSMAGMATIILRTKTGIPTSSIVVKVRTTTLLTKSTMCTAVARRGSSSVPAVLPYSSSLARLFCSGAEMMLRYMIRSA